MAHEIEKSMRSGYDHDVRMRDGKDKDKRAAMPWQSYQKKFFGLG